MQKNVNDIANKVEKTSPEMANELRRLLVRKSDEENQMAATGGREGNNSHRPTFISTFRSFIGLKQGHQQSQQHQQPLVEVTNK